jgi:site-specific DNA-methyltransferase (adenine-specific)
LIEAFRRSHDGYSPDRLIADPALNQRFVEVCRSLGLPGDARTWNWRLFNCRKAGKLVNVPTARQTAISWEGCDEYLFASEIALAQMLEDGCEGLDEILCDPELAARFDNLARSYAPGFDPFRYRWAALKLRKEAKSARVRAKVLAPVRLNRPVSVSESDWSHLAGRAGLYLVTGDPAKEKLYVGETLNLGERLQSQFRKDLLGVWFRHTQRGEILVRTFTADRSPPELLGYQSLLVGKHKPKLNFKELAA